MLQKTYIVLLFLSVVFLCALFCDEEIFPPPVEHMLDSCIGEKYFPLQFFFHSFTFPQSQHRDFDAQ